MHHKKLLELTNKITNNKMSYGTNIGVPRTPVSESAEADENSIYLFYFTTINRGAVLIGTPMEKQMNFLSEYNNTPR